MKKNNLRSFISGVLVTLLCVCLISSAAATIGQRTLTANYRDIKIVLDGKQLTPKDATGSVVEPFTVNGTTYLPVRAIGEALGLSVDWDGSTSTVSLTSASTEQETSQPALAEPTADQVARRASAYAFLRSWIDANHNTTLNGNPAYSEDAHQARGDIQYSLTLDKAANDITARIRSTSSFDGITSCVFIRLAPDGQAFPVYLTLSAPGEDVPFFMGMGDVSAPSLSSDSSFSFSAHSGDQEAVADREAFTKDALLDLLSFTNKVFEDHVYGDYTLADFGFTSLD